MNTRTMLSPAERMRLLTRPRPADTPPDEGPTLKPQSKQEARLEDIEFMVTTGEHLPGIAQRLQMSLDYLTTYLRRNRPELIDLARLARHDPRRTQ